MKHHSPNFHHNLEETEKAEYSYVNSGLTILGLLLLAILAFTSCTELQKEPDYNSMITVGNSYLICSYASKDPFDPQTRANVTVLKKIDGYVQYCWTHDLNKPYKTKFSRSCKEFVKLIDNCKN